MSRTVQVILLVVMICVSEAQLFEAGQSCQCQRFRKFNRAGVKHYKIYPASIFCPKVEIVVTMKNGFRTCLDQKAVETIMSNITRQQRSTVGPTGHSSTSSSTNTY